MFEKFEWIEGRYEELSEAIVQPEILADQPRYQALLKERATLEPMVHAWRAYQALLRHLDEAKQMMSDPELGDVAKAEVDELTRAESEQAHQLRVLLLPDDPDDHRGVVMEIRSGTGGEEACLFAADLLRVYERYAARRGWRYELISLSDTELGGAKEAVFTLSGPDVYARMKFESGVHRVQRVPVTDTTGKKQTSTCTVAVLPEPEEVEVSIDPKDVRVDVYRSTGHGGQCVNTTDSAVRVTHLPTGLVVTCQDQKSQLKNRDQAMRVLRARLLEMRREQAHETTAQARRIQVGTGDRSERIRTYNFHEGRVTDHRIGLTIYRIADVMNGDLDEIIDALRLEEQNRKLREAASPAATKEG